MRKASRVARVVLAGAAAGLLPLAGCTAASQRAAPAAPAVAGAVGFVPDDLRDVPDPSIIKHGDHYYVFSTAPGIQIRRSPDLVHWELIGTVLPDALPSWAQREVPGTEYPWAPEIAYFNGRYHLYYALSTFGSQRSVLALATNTTLDPADPSYRWVDHGKVLESFPGRSSFNAIDGAIALDAEGQPWLTWGSFWGGIKMRKVDPATGMLSRTDTTTYSLATRAGVDPENPNRNVSYSQAIEAPYIIRRGGYYYLFVSWDACCLGAKSTYNVRVGRSSSITGPYLDREGVDMLKGGGTLVLAGHDDIAGPGHASILQEGDRYYIAHHYVNIKEGPASPDAPLAIPRSLQIRPLYWGWHGWPIAGEPLTPAR